VACPFFWPVERHEAELWAHRQRLPLGDGFTGECRAPSCAGRKPGDDELKECCNLGYATACPHLPKERAADAVHFSASGEGTVRVNYVMVKDQAPGEHGMLEFDTTTRQWRNAHSDLNVQRMAECYVNAWLVRHGRHSG
jgi:hypothetical protein